MAARRIGRMAPLALVIALAAGCSQGGKETPEEPAAVLATLDSERCGALDAAGFGAANASAKWVDATGDLPDYCEVTATLSPAQGSSIGAVYRLPAEWNGKVLGIGGGGWAGNVTLEAAAEALSKGYATLQTDGGHPGTSPWDNSWATNPESATDFSWRAIHEMTVAGKQLVSNAYDAQHRRAYFQGCSTGGRMALMEAQRFPEDYDAIIAGAPVYTLQVQTSAVLRNNTFARNNGGFSADDLKLVQSSVLAACDADDGLKDGLVGDPRQCRWNPADLECSGEKTATCLAPAQVEAIRTIYNGIHAPDGQWAMFPMSRGGEPGWSLFVGTAGAGEDATGGGGLLTLAPLLFDGRKVDFAKFDPRKDVPAVRQSAFAQTYEAKDPQLQPFFQRGGKLLLWHGENDPGPSPVGTIDYAQSVQASTAGAKDGMRLFLMPGVEHCRGGPGADQVALLDALDGWVERGTAPERLIGRKADSDLVRPHCAWPNMARYGGSGDANDPANWQCTPRAGTSKS